MKKAIFILLLSSLITRVQSQDQTINGTTFKTNGNVGVGTSTPKMKLHVAGSTASGYNNTVTLDNHQWFNVGNVSGYGFINWFSQANENRDNFINTHPSVKASGISGGSGEIKFRTSEANTGVGQPSGLVDRLVIKSNGNIGIGTTSPDMKLTVNGNIHAEEVKIDLNIPAPDYVFYENYNLKSIDEVERFIKINNHLPEIPSAAEFKQNGLLLAEMDMNLLKKIEELTLYIIQQQKEIEALKKQNSDIERLKVENSQLSLINQKLLELQLRIEEMELK